MYRILMLAAVALIAVQNPHQHEGHSPYASETRSEIAALTVEEVAGLREGAGMGFARAAELNSYPGPKHVLELAEELELTDAQRVEVEAIFERMHGEAVRLGEELLEQEALLDRRFAHRHIDVPTLEELTAEIGRVRAALRAAHLRAHLETTGLLTQEQISDYDAARGYLPPR